MENWAKDFNHYPYTEVPLLDHCVIKKDIINMKWTDFTEFVVDCIEKDFYVITFLDIYFIPVSTDCYQKRHFIHTTFIYGFDKYSNLIYIADFYNNNKYNFYPVSFMDLRKAYEGSLLSKRNLYSDITLIKPRKLPEEIVKINTESITKKLYDFLEAKDSTEKLLNNIRYYDEIFYYGISYFDELINDLLNYTANNTDFHVICDHAKLMEYKLDIMYTENIFNNYDDYIKLKSNISDINKLSVINRNLYVKHSIKNDNNIVAKNENLHKIKNNIQNIKKMFIDFYKYFIYVLRNLGSE